MGFQIYRFEVVSEIARNGVNVIYDVRDKADASAFRLYEWTPSPDEAAAAAEGLKRVSAQLDGVEVFPVGHRCYLAAPLGREREALKTLRANSLFPGIWPGVFEVKTTSVRQESAHTRNYVLRFHLSRAGHFVIWTTALILIGVAVLLAWRYHVTSQGVGGQGAPHGSQGVSERVRINSFNAGSKPIKAGQDVFLRWEVVNAREVWIKGLGPQPILVRSSGSQTFHVPRSGREIVLEAVGGSDDDVATEMLHVASAAP